MSTKRIVTWEGVEYRVRSDSAEIPDLGGLSRIDALVWLNQNTYRRGRGINTRPKPLAGMGGAIRLTVR